MGFLKFKGVDIKPGYLLRTTAPFHYGSGLVIESTTGITSGNYLVLLDTENYYVCTLDDLIYNSCISGVWGYINKDGSESYRIKDLFNIEFRNRLV